MTSNSVFSKIFLKAKYNLLRFHTTNDLLGNLEDFLNKTLLVFAHDKYVWNNNLQLQQGASRIPEGIKM